MQGSIAMVTFCDASFAGEGGHTSQRGRIHYLMSHKDAVIGNSNMHGFHLLSFSSSTLSRVCRATLRCEAYSLQHGMEHGDKLWEEVARRSMLHVAFSSVQRLQNLDKPPSFIHPEAGRKQTAEHGTRRLTPNFECHDIVRRSIQRPMRPHPT